jgi:membrane-bound serine protease (ClpP class)
MRKGQLFSFLLLLFFLLAPFTVFAAGVYEIRVEGVISPPVSAYIKESLRSAEDNRAQALLVLLDTPGGLDASMREIVKAILDSPVPVIVYVSPPGARAASAGAIILISAHVAAMAPGTNVGAAHPVSLGGGRMDKEMMAKVVQDAEAYARSLAAKRGRNTEWAARAVRESVSVTADEALQKGVIDLVAPGVDDLLTRVDGRTVEVGSRKVVLSTKGAEIRVVEMPFRYRFLSFVSDPNVAYLLMMVGFYGLLFEIFRPGAVVPGVLGGICLILAFYAFQTIPINYAGLFLILLGVLFFLLEIKITSYGVLSVAGVASIVIGSIMLVDLPGSWPSISWSSIVTVALVSVIFFLGVLSYAVKAHLLKVQTGKEGMIGETGTARTDIAPRGKVFIHGELWDAESEAFVKEGDRIVVVEVEGMVVKVKKEGRN